MDIYSELKSHIASVYKNIPMCEFTTLRIGGPADILVEARSVDDIVFTQKIAKKYKTFTKLRDKMKKLALRT